MLKKLGFTLIEMLVVISIIGILLSVSAVAYTQVSKQSRDARRKTDLEQLRGALEQYRATNNYYPSGTTMASLNILVAPVKYIESIPSDPKTNNPAYEYAASPVNCDNSVTYCVSYTLTATLENPSGFRYGVTPYGATASPTPTPGGGGT